MKSWLTLVGPAALCAGLLAVSGCNRDSAQAAGAGGKMPPPLVVVSDSITKDVPVYLDEIGKCTAVESVTITPEVAGQITARHFEDGAELKKGQPLFDIDPRPYKAALDSAKAQLAQAKASQAFAKLELERYTAVANTRAISKSDFDTKQNAMDVANAQFEAAEAAVETAQVNLDYCKIASPIDGRAGARLVDAGNVVKANEGSLLVVQRLDSVYADFTVNERELAQVRENMAHGTLKTMVKLPTDGDTGREGDLIFLDNAVQDATGTVKLRALVPNKDRHFWPGQFVDVRLVLKLHKDAVMVPNAAPQIGQKGPFLFVVKDGPVAEQRPVVLGQRQGDMVVIDSGLEPGEKVIVEGQLMVVPGGPVRLQAPMPDAAPGENQPKADESKDARKGGPAAEQVAGGEK